MDILRDDEAHELKYKPGGRLDMSHGFLHHIRRNQIADDYDKEVKQAKELQRRRHTTTPRRPRRPDIQVYHPGSESGAGAEAEEWNESGSSTETEIHGTELFWLDYQADSGAITSFLVHKGDKPKKVVERVAEKNILDSAMRSALEARIRKEMDKRRDKR
uniref:Chromosome 2 open reading frame 68 n=1 Tax=Seriola lalandi dorsalis TaxID=1841481 RepID=A0A3B4Y1M9_SERLL